MPRPATVSAKRPSTETNLDLHKETGNDHESPGSEIGSSLPFSGITRDTRVTRNNILGLQRTIGNQQVMRLLAGTRGPVAKPVSSPSIQRKIAFSPSINTSITKLAVTADNTIFSSTFKDVKGYMVSYLRAKNEVEEANYLKKIERELTLWRADNPSPKSARDREKQTVLTSLEKIVREELARIESKQNLAEIGLTDSFLKELTGTEYSNLFMAVYLAKQGNIQAADQYLDNLRATRGSAVNLIRSNIVRTYIGKIDPKLAKAMNKSNFKASDKTAGAGAKFIQSEANKLVDEQAADPKGFETKYGKKMAIETTQLSNKSQMAAFGYKDEAPLRDLANAGKTIQSGKATQADKVKTPEAQAAMKTLTGKEMTVLVGYTSNLYSSFSNPLRQKAGKTNFTKDNMALTQTAISAMNKFKSYTGKVYRHDSIYPGFKELNRVGGITTDLGFMSTAKEQGGASSGGTDHDVLLVLNSKTGKEIAIASIFGGEGEILFKPGTRFKVTKAAEKDPVNGWQNADQEIQQLVNLDGNATALKMVVIKEEV